MEEKEKTKKEYKNKGIEELILQIFMIA